MRNCWWDGALKKLFFLTLFYLPSENVNLTSWQETKQNAGKWLIESNSTYVHLHTLVLLIKFRISQFCSIIHRRSSMFLQHMHSTLQLSLADVRIAGGLFQGCTLPRPPIRLSGQLVSSTQPVSWRSCTKFKSGRKLWVKILAGYSL